MTRPTFVQVIDTNGATHAINVAQIIKATRVDPDWVITLATGDELYFDHHQAAQLITQLADEI